MGCGCGGAPTGRVQRLTYSKFGPDLAPSWGKISRSFKAKFICIGPESEWDCCLLANTPAGDLVVSTGAPAVIPIDNDLLIRPWRTRGNDDVPIAKLDLLVFDHIPAVWPAKRAPRIYPYTETLLTATEASINASQSLYTGFFKPITIAGAKSFSLFLANTNAVDISWRLVTMRQSGGTLFPVSPSGYVAAAPTYNTLAAGKVEAWHLDVETDADEHMVLFAKCATGGQYLATYCEVRD